jgi:hypothetical protein
MPSPETPLAAASAQRPFALVGAFDTPDALVQACEAVRDAGYRHFDAHSPFPVHGIERAMGLRPSRVPWVALAGGIAGGLGALLLQMWSMGVEYPQNISGKPLFAYQAYVPIAFEATILLAAFGAFLSMWALNGLPRLFHPVMQHPCFAQASDDRFLLSVESADPEFDVLRTRELLRAAGARDIEEVLP